MLGTFRAVIMYITDQVDSQVCFFADDCLLYRPINNDSDHMAFQEDLKNLEVWAHWNKLSQASVDADSIEAFKSHLD